MKYERMVKLHKLSYINWNFGSAYGFEPKEEYTIFDLIGFIPGVVFTKFSDGVFWFWVHRKKWVISRKSSVVDENMSSVQRDETK
jgi:hypothetical protein